MNLKTLNLGLLLLLFGCSGADYKNPNDVTTNTNNPLGLDLAKTDSAAAKTEMVLRKIRLAEAILAKKLNLKSPDLSRCVSGTEINQASEWKWKCPDDATTGKSYFTYLSGALQKVEIELETKVKDFGIAKEVFIISEIDDSTDFNGVRSVSFKFSWKLYRDTLTPDAIVCDSSSAPLQLNIEKQQIDDKTEVSFISTLQLNRLSLTCDQSLSAPTVNDTTIEFTNSTLNVVNSLNTLAGPLNFTFKDHQLTYIGTMNIDDLGITEPKDNKLRPLSCSGQTLCFP